MNLSFIFCSVICIIMVQAGDIRPPKGIIVPLPDDETSDLNCLLFGNAACQTTCALIGKLFVQGGEGSCDAKSICNCTLLEPPTIDELWNSKFYKNEQSVQLLNLLKNQPKSQAFKITMAILKEPYLSNPRVRQIILQSFGGKIHSLAKKLNPLPDKKLINQYVDMNETFDQKNLYKLSEFIKKELQELPKNVTDEVEQNNYKDRLRELLDNLKNKNTAERIMDQFERIPYSYVINEALRELKQKSKSLQEENYVDDEDDGEDDENDTGIKVERVDRVPFQLIIDMISASVTKRLIAYSDGKSSNAGKGNNPETETAETKWKPAVTLVRDTKYDNGNVKREWTGDDTYITYYKYAKTKQLHLEWHSGDTTIDLIHGRTKLILQHWIFGPVDITLSIDRKGNKEYKWNLGHTTLLYTETSKGEKANKWEGEEDPQALEKYKDNIRSWCNQNVDLFPERCVIFDN